MSEEKEMSIMKMTLTILGIMFSALFFLFFMLMTATTIGNIGNFDEYENLKEQGYNVRWVEKLWIFGYPEIQIENIDGTLRWKTLYGLGDDFTLENYAVKKKLMPTGK